MKTYTGEQLSQINAAVAHLWQWRFDTRIPRNVVSKIGAGVDIDFEVKEDDDGFRYIIVDQQFRICVCETPQKELMVG